MSKPKQGNRESELGPTEIEIEVVKKEITKALESNNVERLLELGSNYVQTRCNFLNLDQKNDLESCFTKETGVWPIPIKLCKTQLDTASLGVSEVKYPKIDEDLKFKVLDINTIYCTLPILSFIYALGQRYHFRLFLSFEKGWKFHNVWFVKDSEIDNGYFESNGWCSTLSVAMERYRKLSKTKNPVNEEYGEDVSIYDYWDDFSDEEVDTKDTVEAAPVHKDEQNKILAKETTFIHSGELDEKKEEPLLQINDNGNTFLVRYPEQQTHVNNESPRNFLNGKDSRKEAHQPTEPTLNPCSGENVSIQAKKKETWDMLQDPKRLVKEANYYLSYKVAMSSDANVMENSKDQMTMQISSLIETSFNLAQMSKMSRLEFLNLVNNIVLKDL